MEQKQYAIILADPPWQYHNKSALGAAERHYPTMPLKDICALPVADLCAPDCTLFLWVTFAMLREAFEVMDAWGFTYVTCAFVWLKKNKISEGYRLGLGSWTRANAEFCLFAKKGRPKRQSANVRQVIEAPMTRHSQKPGEARRRIVQLMGDLPRLELFAREKAPGWDVWGNEVQSDILL